MDIFKLGKLKLGNHEPLIVGDPCYFANTPNGCHTIDLGWAAGNYEVYLATEGGLPLALILSRYGSLHPSIVDWFMREEPAEYLGVDSGQMAMIAASVLPTWTHNDQVDWDAPACDYDYASIATLQSQLRANLIGSRLTFVSAEANTSIGTAVASSTRHGDGEYPLVIVRSSIPSYETGEREIAAVAVFFDWEDEEGFDEKDAHDPLSDEDGEGLVDKVDAEARRPAVPAPLRWGYFIGDVSTGAVQAPVLITEWDTEEAALADTRNRVGEYGVSGSHVMEALQGEPDTVFFVYSGRHPLTRHYVAPIEPQP